MLKIVISPYLSEKSSHFDEILYTAADLELDERDVIKNEKFALDRLRVRQNLFLVIIIIIIIIIIIHTQSAEPTWFVSTSILIASVTGYSSKT